MCGCKLRGKGNKQILKPIPLKLVMWKIRGWLLIYMGGMMCGCKLRGEENIRIIIYYKIYLIINASYKFDKLWHRPTILMARQVQIIIYENGSHVVFQ